MKRNGKAGGSKSSRASTTTSKVTGGKSSSKATRKKTASAETKLSPEQRSDQATQENFLSHKRKLVPLRESFKNAKANLDKAYELAKKEGHPKKDFELAFKLETEEGTREHAANIERTLTIARYVNSKIGEQLELIPRLTQSEYAFEEGRTAALDHKPCKPPVHFTDAVGRKWIEGYHVGAAFVEKKNTDALQGGFKKLGDSVPVRADDEEAPSTFVETSHSAPPEAGATH